MYGNFTQASERGIYDFCALVGCCSCSQLPKQWAWPLQHQGARANSLVRNKQKRLYRRQHISVTYIKQIFVFVDMYMQFMYLCSDRHDSLILHVGLFLRQNRKANGAFAQYGNGHRLLVFIHVNHKFLDFSHSPLYDWHLVIKLN